MAEVLDVLLPIVSMAIVPLSSWIIVRFTMKRAKNELLDFMQSQEGLQFMAQLGAAFASGAMTQLRMGKPAGGVKLGPIRIPQQLIDMAMMKGLQMLGITPASPESGQG